MLNFRKCFLQDQANGNVTNPYYANRKNYIEHVEEEIKEWAIQNVISLYTFNTLFVSTFKEHGHMVTMLVQNNMF